MRCPNDGSAFQPFILEMDVQWKQVFPIGIVIGFDKMRPGFELGTVGWQPDEASEHDCLTTLPKGGNED